MSPPNATIFVYSLAVTSAKVPPVGLVRAVDRIRHHLRRLHQRSAPPPAVLLETILKAWVAQGITAAVQLGVADALADGPLRPDELARRIDANPDALNRLMRALVSEGIFRRTRDGRYALNALADGPVRLHYPGPDVEQDFGVARGGEP